MAIGVATDGAFYAESLGRDLGGKLAGAAENHSGPPGYYLATIWVSFWPASLLLPAGAVFAWTAARRGGDSSPARAMRLCIAWVVPFWVVLELAPTKLIHYPLPLFPALCLACASAVLGLLDRPRIFPKARAIGALAFAVASAVVIGAVAVVQATLGAESWLLPSLAVAAVAGIGALAASFGLALGRIRTVLIGAGVAALPLTVFAYGLLMPQVDAARVSERISAKATAPILSPDYEEPSLLYHGGHRNVRLGIDANWRDYGSWTRGTLLLDTTDETRLDAVLAQAASDGVCLETGARVAGVNYSRGREVALLALRQTPCPSALEQVPGEQAERERPGE